ncbi:hypothetical protein ABT297_39865 [Dactylosporangium sp. NPDC000555]|uniref:hypothetical protein n=1 Tax=Dactylosporangium sp. NPDC000555 TaxID=3154260 RepID=UPI00332027CB
MGKSPELKWVLRPSRGELAEHDGKEIYAFGDSDAVGRVEVTLTDGTRVRVRRCELVPC